MLEDKENRELVGLERKLWLFLSKMIIGLKNMKQG